LSSPALGFVEHGEIVERQGGVRVVRSENLFLDRQRAPVKRFGSIAFCAGAVQGRQIVQIYSDFVMF